MSEIARVVLIGLSGSGKSTVAKRLAELLDWQVIDTDEEIEREAGITIPEIFARDGEAAFRAMERATMLAAIAADRVVIATGGGAVMSDDLWSERHLVQPDTLTVTLDVRPEIALERLRVQHEREGAAVARPMIAGDDPLARISELKTKRQSYYDRANLTLAVDNRPPEQVASDIAFLVDSDRAVLTPALRLNAPSESSEIYIRPGASRRIGEIVRTAWPNARRVWIVSDATVAALHGDQLVANLCAAGVQVALRAVPPGESSKSWGTAGELLDWLLDHGIERGDVVIALGGGVIGDLAGFVAATVLRGVALVQVPTSLLAMVDSSIGGKTGINHRTGKNLIGSFYQPPVVVIDPSFLATLPPRELRAGWGEIVKHAIIQPSTPGGQSADLLTFLDRNGERLRALDEPVITYAIWRNVALKAAVVEADEREAGIRANLNFGHTLGHAIEAADYRLLHGEAIAVGMRAAMRIGRQLDMVDEAAVGRVDRLLDAFELPRTTASDHAAVLAKLGSDKKRIAGKQRWVLPLAAGGVELRTDVPEEVVLAALRDVSG